MISLGESFSRTIPSFTYNSSSGTRRGPLGPAISTSAPRHISAGAVSPENAAQQNFPPGATWHRSPSFFRQKPQLLRHNSDWLYHRQRVSRQRLPPIVPMLRRTGEATVFAAWYSTG